MDEGAPWRGVPRFRCPGCNIINTAPAVLAEQREQPVVIDGPELPKKLLSSFMLFSNEQHSKGVDGRAEWASWKLLGAATKDVYTKQAEAQRAAHAVRVEAFEKEHPGEIQRQKLLKSAAAAVQLKAVTAAGNVSLSGSAAIAVASAPRACKVCGERALPANYGFCGEHRARAGWFGAAGDSKRPAATSKNGEQLQNKSAKPAEHASADSSALKRPRASAGDEAAARWRKRKRQRKVAKRKAAPTKK